MVRYAEWMLAHMCIYACSQWPTLCCHCISGGAPATCRPGRVLQQLRGACAWCCVDGAMQGVPELLQLSMYARGCMLSTRGGGLTLC